MVIQPAGCEDGTVTVWDLRTRQPIRTLQKGGKGPVTGLLVMDRPAFLAAGQGGRGDRSNKSAYNSASRKGPQRPQPLAPFSKYYGVAGGLKPWEGVPVVIDGSTPYRYCNLSVKVWHKWQPLWPLMYSIIVTKAYMTRLSTLTEVAVLSVALLLAKYWCVLSNTAVYCKKTPKWLQLRCKHLGTLNRLKPCTDWDLGSDCISVPESQMCCS